MFLGGVDFNYRNYKVPIPAGEQFSRTLLLDAIDDTVVEPQLESYSLLINESSLPANVVAGKRKTMTVNIKDDDGKLISCCVFIYIAVNYVLFDYKICIA